MKRTISLIISVVGFAFLVAPSFYGKVSAQSFPVTVSDQTQTTPLDNPDASFFQPRYISGFGQDDAFTVFFEDRDSGNLISYTSTTTGPTGFSAATTASNISDTHFLIKDWPINVDGTDYAYRAWGSVGNNMQHHFYVSNDLTNWTLVSTFTIANALGFADRHGWAYYGFHDVILLNGTYYAFAESNKSQTMIVRSAKGDDEWEAFASIGGRPGWGPLELPVGVSYGWTPSGSFVDLGHDRGYGKIYVDPRDSHFYLAINTTSKAGMAPADLEAAFINPANWTWHDGTVGAASNPILSETSEHDLRECWVVPNTDPDADWVIIYDADFGSADGGKALGYATLSPPLPPPAEVWVDDDYCDGCDNDDHTWGYDAFDNIQDGVDAVVGSTVNVAAGAYNENVVIDKAITLDGSGSGDNPSVDTIIASTQLNDKSIRITRGGNSETERVVVRDLRATGGFATTLGGNNGAGIEIGGPSAINHLTFENVVSKDNHGHGLDYNHIVPSGDIELINCEFSGNGGAGLKIPQSIGALDDVTITNCKFNNNGIIGLYAAPSKVTDLNITDSEAKDNGLHGMYFAWLEGGLFENVLLENNGVSDRDEPSGIKFSAHDSQPVKDVVIRNCVFKDNGQAAVKGIDDDTGQGLLISSKSVESSNILVENSVFEHNKHNGITVYGRSGGTVTDMTVSCSNIVSNPLFGLSTLYEGTPSGVIADARYNWWGDAGGPYHPETNPDGTGDTVSDNVDFDLWHTSFAQKELACGVPPLSVKYDIVFDLAVILESADKKDKHRIEKALKHLNKSLDPELWVDDSHLTKKGKKVFKEEEKAVHELMKVKRVDVSAFILGLVTVDESLAQTAIDVAYDNSGDDKKIVKTEKEMEKAQKKLDKGHFDKAIEHYKKAWQHAQKAMK